MADWTAGTLVNPKGMTKKMTASVAGGAYAGAPEVPNFGRVGYVGVNANELALVKTKSGAFKMKVTDEVLASAPRSDIAASELDQGKMLSHLKIEFTNGVTWEFDIPKMAKKTAQELVSELGGRLT